MSWNLNGADVSEEELVARATRAWFMTARAKGYIPDIPANYSGVEECDNRLYVVLKNVNGMLAIYRIRNDGMLKALKRWPKAAAPSTSRPWLTNRRRASLRRFCS
jgi:hypothetical protein